VNRIYLFYYFQWDRLGKKVSRGRQEESRRLGSEPSERLLTVGGVEDATLRGQGCCRSSSILNRYGQAGVSRSSVHELVRVVNRKRSDRIKELRYYEEELLPSI
jgi:hypothetical protein